jgi:hypothetical protein
MGKRLEAGGKIGMGRHRSSTMDDDEGKSKPHPGRDRRCGGRCAACRHPDVESRYETANGRSALVTHCTKLVHSRHGNH